MNFYLLILNGILLDTLKKILHLFPARIVNENAKSSQILTILGGNIHHLSSLALLFFDQFLAKKYRNCIIRPRRKHISVKEFNDACFQVNFTQKDFWIPRNNALS